MGPRPPARSSYSCEKCRTTFTSKNGLLSHQKVVHGPRILLPCPQCPKQISGKSNLTKHIKEIHSTLRPFPCRHCDATFKQKGGLTQHTKLIHGTGNGPRLPCELCGKLLSNKHTKENHIRAVHLKETQFPCRHPGCRVAVSSQAQFIVHSRTHLPREERNLFSCSEETCEKTFISETWMKIHHRTVHEGKGFKCPHCEKVKTSQHSLDTHILTHTGKKDFACPQCSKLFALKSNMLKHLEIVHGDEKLTRKWSCSICSKSFKTKVEVTRHERTHLSEEDKQKLKIHSCSQCPRKFITLAEVTQHIKLVHCSKTKEFQCLTCDKGYTNARYLAHHVWYVHERKQHRKCYFCRKMIGNMNEHIGIHTREKPFKCTKCPKRFIRHSEIKPHLSSRHIKEELKTNWKCAECPKQFKSQGGWRNHVQIKHRGILRYRCNFCFKRTSCMTNLENHIRVHHTKEIPFRCSVQGCEFKSQTSAGLHSHKKRGQHDNKRWKKCYFCSAIRCVKKHYFDEDKEAYKCPSCAAYLANRSHFLRHVKSHNADEKVKCYFCSKSLTNISQHLRIHTMEKLFSCKVCGMDFGSAAQLRGHTTNKHTLRLPRRTHSCPIAGCWRSYFTSKQLLIHENLHKNPKFVCGREGCGWVAFSKIDLVQHQLAHKKEAGEKVYNCVSCSYLCARKEKLQHHCNVYGHGVVGEKKRLSCYFCNLDLVSFKILTNHMRTYHSVY